MKPEQASKVTMRMPTLLPFGEGRVSGEVIDMRTARSAGVVGTARRKGRLGNQGIPIGGEGRGLNVVIGRRSLVGVGQGHMSLDAG